MKKFLPPLKSGLKLLEITYPAALALFLFVIISFLLYSGNRRDRISLNIEGLLIRKSLAHSPWKPENPNQVVAVSLEASDLEKVGKVSRNQLVDAPLAIYAEILNQVLKAEPKSVFLSWISAAQSDTSESFNPLIRVLSKYPHMKDRVFLPYPVDEIKLIPADLKNSAQILEGDDCQYDVQSYCAYNKEWNNWVIQLLANRYWKGADRGANNDTISENLPHFRPMYLLNLPAEKYLQNLSFSDVLVGGFTSDQIRGRDVFIGSAIIQNTAANGDHNLLRRTYIAQDSPRTLFEKDATPYHHIWALMTQMFMEERMVVVAPQWISILIAITLCSIIVLLLKKVGTIAALSVYMAGFLAYPFFNDWGVKYLQIYIPMFEAIYLGLATFLFAAFGKLSQQLFLGWKLDEQQKNLSHIADLKDNFISLISHNLNTPVARMQGLLEVLERIPGQNQPLSFARVYEYLARMQLTVRSVLISTAVNENALVERVITLAKLTQEWKDQCQRLLTRLGISVEIRDAVFENDDQRHIPFLADLRSLVHLISAIMVYIGPGRWQLEFGIDENASLAKCLTMTFRYFSPQAEASAMDLVERYRSLEETRGRELIQKNFFKNVLANLLTQLMQRYEGEIYYEKKPNDEYLKVQLYFS